MTFGNAVVRVAAATGLLVGSSLVGCSSSEDPPIAPGPPGASGSSSTTAGAGGSATAGSAAGGAGGSAGATGGSGGGGKCPGNQMSQPDGSCKCPAYAATYCEALTKCVSEMKDPENCGMCGMACNPTSACSAGVCTPDLESVGELAGCGTLMLVSAATKIYALSTMTGDLNAFAPAGGAPTKLGTAAGGTAFAVDATNAYVAAGMTVKRIPLAGGEAATVVTDTKPIKDVAVSGTTLYYAVGTDVKSIAVTATNGTPAGMAVALGASQGEPQGLAASGGLVLYASALAMNVERCDTTKNCRAGEGMDTEDRGPGHYKIGQSQGGLIFGHRTLQTDGTKVFWVNNGLQGAPIMPDAEGKYPGVGIATAIEGGTLTAFAVAGTTAYFTEQVTGSEPPVVLFEKSAFGEQDATRVARNLPTVTSIVTDATSVYLASGCKILKTAL